MTKPMSSRERVLTALHHQDPDRVPTALWGSYYTLQDETYFNLVRYLGLGEPVSPFRRLKSRNANYIDDRILDRLETDIRYVWLGFDDLGGAHPDTLQDAWGVRWQRSGPIITAVSHPLAEATLEEVEAYPWPNPERYIRLDELRERVRALKQRNTHAIAARAVNSYGPFEQASALRGREQLLMDVVLNPELATAIIGRVTDVIVRLTEIYLDVAGRDIDIIEIPGDDYGGMRSLLISPNIFDTLLAPALARIIDPIKAFRRDLTVAFHSDGAIAPLLGRFVALGIDLFHPLEPLPANDMAKIKAAFGNRLSFMGAIDICEALPGPADGLEAEVQRRIELLAPGGGYILAPANHVQKDVPPENIVALYRLAREHGRYPLFH
ncbi:MAG: uroporphyrinogen decarboxylase family protein [Anaerolineae bacterium]